jgi:hypothetical protein
VTARTKTIDGTKHESESKTRNGHVKAIKVAMKVRTKEALTQIKAKGTPKVNEVKATESTLIQLNQRVGLEPTNTLPSPFKTLFNTFLCTCLLFIFIFKNFISILNLIEPDSSDHPFQTVTVGKPSGRKTFCLP